MGNAGNGLRWITGELGRVYLLRSLAVGLDFGLPVHTHSAKRQLTHQDFAHFRGRCELPFTGMRECRAAETRSLLSKRFRQLTALIWSVVCLVLQR